MILEVYGRYVGSRMVVPLYRSFSILSSWQLVWQVGRPVVWSIKPDIHRKVSREINPSMWKGALIFIAFPQPTFPPASSVRRRSKKIDRNVENALQCVSVLLSPKDWKRLLESH